MSDNKFNVRKLLELVAENIETKAQGVYVAMNDAHNEGDTFNADWLEKELLHLTDAENHVHAAIEDLDRYDDLIG